ncbi:hypothetical protein ACLQ3B_22025 [Micromonospora sp. DT53]|uniref:hypothetical protein n=1 Tax=Micromonospora sp. DT53 TaxID=3393444 RepID=UPI003CECB2E4
MRYRLWDVETLRAYERAGLGHQQRALIERLLRALEEGTFLSEHVSTAPSVLLALHRARHAFDSCLSTSPSQPRADLVVALLDSAFTETHNANSAYSLTPSGSSAIASAGQALTGSRAAMSGGLSTTAGRRAVHALDQALAALREAVPTLFDLIWSGTPVAASAAGRIRDEVAVSVVLEGRDGRAFGVDLLRLLNKGVAERALLAGTLWPPRQGYRVALTVAGTRSLEGLDRLLPGARQWPLGGLPPLGIPRIELQVLMDQASASTGAKLLLIVPTMAADGPTAVATARRDLAETLDQYAAGQRLLDLAIGPAAVAIGPGSKATTLNLFDETAKAARPLTFHWAAPVRPALRMANLAWAMDAPVAGVMLAWSALESLGVKKSHRALVAKACALHSVRQQILSVFKSVTASATARLRLGRYQVALAQEGLRKAQVALARVELSPSPRAAAAAAGLRTESSKRRAELAAARYENDQLSAVLLPAVAVVREHLLGGGDQQQPLSMSSYTLDINAFFDVLLNPTAAEPHVVGEVRRAVQLLAEHGGGISQELWESWRARLVDPSAVADWLDAQEHNVEALLTWMYVSRNLAVHNGEFAMPADTLTAHAAKGIIDMVLEFLGHWYQHCDAQGLPDPDAMSVIRNLAQRKDRLNTRLRAATSCRPLEVAAISAADGDCWGRS